MRMHVSCELNSSKRMSKQRSLATCALSFVILGVVGCYIAVYVYTGVIGFLEVKENPNRRIVVEGEVAKGEAPCPQIAIKKAKMKFLNIDQNNREKIFWYKIIMEQPRVSHNDDRYALYFYHLGFHFTFVDEYGSVVCESDVPGAMLFLGPGEHVYMNNPSKFPRATAEKIRAVYVTFKVSAQRR